MGTLPIVFNGDIPQNYEEFLTPFLFEPFAVDLLEKIDTSRFGNVLELASGTGVVTKQLLRHLPASAHLTATDLQADMLNFAKNIVGSSAIVWDMVDMTSIPYNNNQFDLIVCQFGVMLVADKLKALSEMHRVLAKGGKLIFSVWGDINSNIVWRIGGETLNTFLGTNPILQDPGPFSLSADAAVGLMKKAGFEQVKVTVVNKTGVIESAALAAKGFTQGVPIFTAVNQKNPSLIQKIQAAMELELIKQLGDKPLRSPLQSLVFEADKQ